MSHHFIMDEIGMEHISNMTQGSVLFPLSKRKVIRLRIIEVEIQRDNICLTFGLAKAAL